VEPSNFAAHVGTKDPVEMTIDPVRYEAITSSDRLVLIVHNQSDQPLKVIGDDSFAVDPRGESHPLPTRTIAPDTSTRLIFPPVRPTYRSNSSSIGFGVGVSSGYYGRAGYRAGGFAGHPYFYDDYPKYYRLEDDGTVYWSWTGDDTDIKVRIVYQLADKQFHHDFTFKRKKM
jgi:hypothetical protein